MIEIRVTDTATPAVAEYRRQVPFATARALSWVAGDLKFEQARSMRGNFTIRRPWVASPGRWHVTRATKQNLRAIVALDEQANFLKDFEAGGRRVMRGWPIAQPTKTLRPDAAKSIPARLYPVNLGFVGFRTPEGGTAFAGGGKGARSKRKRQARKTYFAQAPFGQQVDAQGAGIWRRTGSGKGARRGFDRIEFLWKYRSSVKIPKRLGFVERARTLVAQRWVATMDRSLRQAVASVVPRSEGYNRVAVL